MSPAPRKQRPRWFAPTGAVLLVLGIVVGLWIGVSSLYWWRIAPGKSVVRSGEVQIISCRASVFPLGGTSCTGTVTWQPESTWNHAAAKLSSSSTITVHTSGRLSGTVAVESRPGALGTRGAQRPREYVIAAEPAFRPAGWWGTPVAVVMIGVVPLALGFGLVALLQLLTPGMQPRAALRR